MEFLVFGIVMALVVIAIILLEMALQKRQRPAKLPVADTRDVATDPLSGDVIFYAGHFWMYQSMPLPGVYSVSSMRNIPDSNTVWPRPEPVDASTWRWRTREGRVVARQGVVVGSPVDAAPPADLEQQRKAIPYRPVLSRAEGPLLDQPGRRAASDSDLHHLE